MKEDKIMKSTKICNILMLIVNLFNILISIGVVINNDIVTTGVTMFSSNIIGDFILWSHSLVIPICNFLMFIINIKNKKLRFVYLILIIYDLGSLLVLLNICEDYEDIIIGIIISIIILNNKLIIVGIKKTIMAANILLLLFSIFSFCKLASLAIIPL